MRLAVCWHDRPLLLSLDDRRQWDSDRLAVPPGRRNLERTGNAPALDQPSHSVHGQAPSLGQLARGKGVKLCSRAWHDSRAFVVLDLVDNPDFITAIIVRPITITILVVNAGLTIGLGTCDVTVNQPLDELGDVLVLEPLEQFGVVGQLP